MNKKITIVILAHNRPELLKNQMAALSKLSYTPLEIIIVDNCSNEPIKTILDGCRASKLLRLSSNHGAIGRNFGMMAATGDIIVTLDDDISVISDESLLKLAKLFSHSYIGCVCFKVLDGKGEKVINWFHRRPLEKYSEKIFITDDISEGAAAFRREALTQCGYYPEEFFISHEGPDLAFRLMNMNYCILYHPKIVVRHSYSEVAREAWRRYYFDTRNLIWLVVRNYPFFHGVGKLFISLTALCIYSLRDGFIIYWVKGLKDGCMGISYAIRTRTSPSENTLRIIKRLNKFRPSLLYLARKRLFSKTIGL